MHPLRALLYTIVSLAALWFAFVATQYVRQRLRMQAIASDLHMDHRTFYIVPGPLDPPTAVAGEERLLVVGVSDENHLVCSIVRNTQCDDWRAQWYVDSCFRPDLDAQHPRLSIWEPMERFPTDADLRRFRTEALKQPWVKWDSPEGSDPSVVGHSSASPNHQASP